MRKHLAYLRYILRHKFFVFVEGRKLGLGVVRLLLHDWQKFTPAEWGPYLEMFYGPASCDDGSGNALWQRYVEEAREAFDRAWLHHQRTGSAHHWQSHVLRLDDGSTKALEMPEKDRREMLADWRAMGRAFGEEPPAVGWYLKNREKMILHPITRAWVEAELGV